MRSGKEIDSGIDTDGKWDIFYTEIRRRIDHQIEENSRLESQALSVLRIIIATIGTILTALSIIITSSYFLEVQPGFSPETLETVSEDLTSSLPVIGEGQVELVLLLLLTVLLGICYFTVIKLFVKVPAHAYLVIKPAVLEPSENHSNIRDLYRSSHRESVVRKEVLEECFTISGKNEDSLNSTRKHWEQCLEELRDGAAIFSLGLIYIITVFALKQSHLTFFLAILFIAWIWYRTDREQAIKRIRPYCIVNRWVDGSTSVLVISMYVGISGYNLEHLGRVPPELIDWAFLLSLVTLLASLYIVNINELLKLIPRTFTLALATLTVYAIVELGTQAFIASSHPRIEGVFSVTFSNLLIAFSLMVVFLIGRVTLGYLIGRWVRPLFQELRTVLPIFRAR